MTLESPTVNSQASRHLRHRDARRTGRRRRLAAADCPAGPSRLLESAIPESVGRV
jgi:hypothetical protein